MKAMEGSQAQISLHDSSCFITVLEYNRCHVRSGESKLHYKLVTRDIHRLSTAVDCTLWCMK